MTTINYHCGSVSLELPSFSGPFFPLTSTWYCIYFHVSMSFPSKSNEPEKQFNLFEMPRNHVWSRVISNRASVCCLFVVRVVLPWFMTLSNCLVTLARSHLRLPNLHFNVIFVSTALHPLPLATESKSTCPSCTALWKLASNQSYHLFFAFWLNSTQVICSPPSCNPSPKSQRVSTPGCFAPIRFNDVHSVMLYGVPIVALTMENQERLCLAQISNTLLKNYSYNEIHNR